MAIEPTTSYALKGGDLKAHVGHKVVVTGTVDGDTLTVDTVKMAKAS